MSAKKGEILCIHYYFPPLNSSAVFRNYNVACTLTSFYEKVHVLTSNNHKRFPNQELPFPKGLFSYDIPTFDYRFILSGKSKKDAHVATAKKSSSSYQFLLKIQKSFPFNLFLAEGNIYYILKAYTRAKKLISNHNIDTIYSSFGPYSDHYVGWLLKRKFPNLKWIADFRDLQIEPIYKNVIWKGLQQKMERKILSKANLITCISQGFADNLSVYRRPTLSMLRGVELRSAELQFESFTIAYTGSLYLNYRDPRPLFLVIQKLVEDGDIDIQDLNILYAGRDSVQFERWVNDYQLSQCFINKGLVSHEEAKTIQNRSHINLLLTSSSPELTGVITGKIFEYFEALNPTLCLISGVQDPEFESLFKELNAGSVVYAPEQTPGKMRNFILDKYKEWKTTHRVAHSLNKIVIKEKYSWNSQVEKMLSRI